MSATTPSLKDIISLSTHILDTTAGKPAHQVKVILEVQNSQKHGDFKKIASGVTNSDGRITVNDWNTHYTDSEVSTFSNTFRITFLVDEYFANSNVEAFYPYVQIVFQIKQKQQHYHVPLLLNPFGYSTYRGS